MPKSKVRDKRHKLKDICFTHIVYFDCGTIKTITVISHFMCDVLSFPQEDMCVRAHVVCVCVCARTRALVRACVCVCASTDT